MLDAIVAIRLTGEDQLFRTLFRLELCKAIRLLTRRPHFVFKLATLLALLMLVRTSLVEARVVSAQNLAVSKSAAGSSTITSIFAGPRIGMCEWAVGILAVGVKFARNGDASGLDSRWTGVTSRAGIVCALGAV